MAAISHKKLSHDQNIDAELVANLFKKWPSIDNTDLLFYAAISMETNVFWNAKKKWLSIFSPFQRYKNIDIEYNGHDAFIRYMYDHSQYIEKPNNLCLCEEENERTLTG